MKFVLIFLMSVLVVSTHQYLHDQLMELPWLMHYATEPVIQKYQPYVAYYHAPIYPRDEENLFPRLTVIKDNSKKDGNGDDQRNEFLDAQSRFKGSNRKRPSYSNEQSDARFLFNLLPTGGTYINPFFKTAMFTSTISISITSTVVCIPANQVLNGFLAIACRRKRNANYLPALEISDENQFVIAPSETLKLIPTVLTSSSHSMDQLSSSKDDRTLEEASVPDQPNFREKRVIFLNRNQFVVSSTVTTFSLSTTTLTIRRNLFANPNVACAAVAAANVPECIACLPPGAIVCPAVVG